MGLWDEWGGLSSFRTLQRVRATLILTATIRVGATITKKNNFLFSGVAEEVVATVRVGATFFF